MTISPQEALQRVIEHREIFHDEMVALMRQIMRGDVSPVMVAAILTGLRVKKETVGEIAGAAQVMREFSRTVEVADRRHLVDIVGTGGDVDGTDWEAVGAMTPRGRVGSPEDIAGLTIFLCSRAGAYTVGEVITCDGGAVVS